MCGINGGWLHGRVDPAVIRDSLDEMAHRGPDDWGVFQDGPVFLGNRRLSVIDLSGGHQPVFNEDRSLAVVFNGEIYNYLELVPGLKAGGHVLKTASDTEVLVHLYEEHGPRMTDLLRGMFAFAIWDSRTRELFLARDRFGKKPLYYCRCAEGLLFASEIKALQRLSRSVGLQLTVRQQSIYDFLSLGAVPQPETIFSEVHALPPASWMIYDGAAMRIQEYWRLQWSPKNRSPYGQILSETRELIADAVKIRLRSDVPLGVFLSGGIDSSVVAYEAGRAAGCRLQTFTVKMPDAALDESAVAQSTARFLGMDNTCLTMELDPVEDVQRVVRVYDQPFADPSAIPSLRMSALAQAHVKVILNGDGGDELFAGYRRYLAFRYGGLVSWLPTPMLGLAGRVLSKLQDPATRRSLTAFAARLVRGLTCPPGERYLIWTLDAWRESDKRLSWLGAPMWPTEDLVESFLPQKALSLDAAMNCDRHINFLSTLLVKMDMATMAASIEGRSPFTDHVLAEYAATIPESSKISWGRTKSVLRDAYAGELPAEVIRGTKRGFEPPLLHWLKHELRPLLMDTVGTPSARVRSFLDGRLIDRLLQGGIMRDRNWGYLVYTVLMLELWLRQAYRDQYVAFEY